MDINVIWNPIPGYEKYKVNNYGNVKSYHASVSRLLRPRTCKFGYLGVSLTANKVTKSFRIHQLVAMAFLGHVPDGTHKLVIDHVNNNRKDNRVDNLRIVSQRENTNQKHLKSTSSYTGVFLDKYSGKWKAAIGIDKKVITIGRYATEIEAHNAYVVKLNSLKN